MKYVTITLNLAACVYYGIRSFIIATYGIAKTVIRLWKFIAVSTLLTALIAPTVLEVARLTVGEFPRITWAQEFTYESVEIIEEGELERIEKEAEQEVRNEYEPTIQSEITAKTKEKVDAVFEARQQENRTDEMSSFTSPREL